MAWLALSYLVHVSIHMPHAATQTCFSFLGNSWNRKKIHTNKWSLKKREEKKKEKKT